MPPQQKSHTTLVISLLILVMLAGGAFWYFFIYKQQTTQTGDSASTDTTFAPFGRPTTNQQGSTSSTGTEKPIPTPAETAVPTLRLLSATPIGGYGASTTASSSIVRWIDRGRGNVLEARSDSVAVQTISNTLLPHVYESAWNKDASGFVGSILGDDNATVSTIFASIIPQTSAQSSSTAPYELRGKSLPSNIISYATSPKKDKVFFFAIQNGRGVGYTAPLSGGTATQIFTTPLTQINVEWPEDNTLAITTKGASDQDGFLYFVDPKTGVWKKIIGPVPGLSARVSRDARYAILSASEGNGVVTSIYSIASSSVTDAIVRTLADKCVWGNFYKNMVYCAVPFQPVSGTYPDGWYKGSISTIDKIWQINASTGEIHLVSSIFTEAKKSIDAYNLGLDNKDNFLYFMNKNDLSFWSLDLVANSGR